MTQIRRFTGNFLSLPPEKSSLTSMLTRRQIRTRTLQALYAYHRAKAANLLLSQEMLEKHFSPNLNSMEFQDKKMLEGKRRLSLAYLQELTSVRPQTTPEAGEEEYPEEIRRAVQQAFQSFNNRNKADFDYLMGHYPLWIEKTYDVYAFLLALLTELADRSAQFRDPFDQSSLSDNRLLIALAKDASFEDLVMRRKASWDEEKSFVTTFFKEHILPNAQYREYCSVTNHTAEDDFVLIKYMIKNILLKNEVLDEYFDRYHLFWHEDREVLRAMLVHTFQPYLETQQIEIEKLGTLWEDGKAFFKNLFTASVSHEAEWIQILLPVLINWEMERMPETDRLLMIMATAEMVHFKDVPVKVTINESIELAKQFSTEKSGNFVNGVLDKISKQLTEQGMLVKTGRGMLDNR